MNKVCYLFAAKAPFPDDFTTQPVTSTTLPAPPVIITNNKPYSSEPSSMQINITPLVLQSPNECATRVHDDTIIIGEYWNKVGGGCMALLMI